MTDKPRGAAWWVLLTQLTALSAGGVCLLFLYAFVPPQFDITYFFSALFAGTLVCVSWAILGLIGLYRYGVLRWTAVPPLLAVVTAVLVALSIPSAFAFTVSKSSMTAAAEECSDVDDEQVRVGLYRVWRTIPLDDGCLLYVRGGGLYDEVGLAYLPNGIPDSDQFRGDPEPDFAHYDGDWYEFVDKF